MATPRCTSRAASNEPHVLRVLCLVILGTSAVVIRRSKLRSKLRGSTSGPWRVVKTSRFRSTCRRLVCGRLPVKIF
jgi:hypothetical protein